MSKSRPQRRTAAEIRKTLSELEKSGLSRARFAADHNLDSLVKTPGPC